MTEIPAELLTRLENALIGDLDTLVDAARDAAEGDPDPTPHAAARLAVAALEAAKVAVRATFALDAPTAPAQPAADATGDTDATGSAGGGTGELSALRDRIANTFVLWSRARITVCEHTRFVEFGTAADAVMDVIRPVLAEERSHAEEFARQAEAIRRQRDEARDRAEAAEAALERARHLHRKMACRCGRDHDLGCQGCLSTTYPCPTIRALTTQDGQ